MTGAGFVLKRRLSLVFVSAMLLTLLPTTQARGVHCTTVTTIAEVQGAGHISPCDGEEVTVTGVVTALAFDGYYVQDPVGDGNPATSEALFVFHFGHGLSVGDEVELTDFVSEFIPGGASTGNLSITQLSFPAISILSSGNPLPAAQVIGTSGRIPPAVDVISKSEEPVNLQDVPGVFNPDNDGIDFYESLEGMLVTVEDTVAVSATRTFSAFSSEMWVLTNDGANIAPADARTARGGINLQPDPDNVGDQNPERVQIQFDATLYPFAVPAITVGDGLGDVTGVVGYSFGNFEVNATSEVVVTPGGLRAETTSFVGGGVSVASYNVLNLSPDSSDDNQRTTLASQIVNNLRSPDVVALQEIQDNSGDTDDGTVEADETLQALVDAIASAGGPDYEFFDVAPADGSSGGLPGGNIRNAFLDNPDRVDLVDFESLTPAVLTDFGVSNPDAFDGTRDPLLATFEFRGKDFTVINNHLSSRFGSTPIFGGPQPFVQAGEIERGAQTEALNQVVDSLVSGGKGKGKKASNPGRVVVLGDLNTMEFTNEITETLPGTGKDKVLTNLIDGLTDDNVYTFNFEGNSQVLDHFLVSDDLVNDTQLDIVHVNVDFARVDDTVGSDHEPLIGVLQLTREVNLQILAINDFHGNIATSSGSFGGTGRADFLATNIAAREAEVDNSIFVSAGDLIGASPLISALFHDEPTIEAMNLMGLDINGVGNHEFDEGPEELLRMANGGSHPVDGDLDGDGFAGADFEFLAANVVVDATGETLFAPYTIKSYQGVKVAFIGMTLEGTPTIVTPSGVAGLTFNDEADTVNALVPELQKRNIESIVVLLHEGGSSNGGPQDCGTGLTGAIADIVPLLDDAVDLVIAGHTNDEFVCEIDGKWVTMADNRGRLFTDIDVTLNPATKDMTVVSIENVANLQGGVVPDPAVTALIDKYDGLSAPLANTVVGSTTTDILRAGNAAGESALGDVIADAQLDATDDPGFGDAVIAFMNPGGIRDDLIFAEVPGGELPGQVTFGEAFSVQPFGNSLVTMTLTGAQIDTLLEQQFDNPIVGGSRILQVSNGFTYTWDASEPTGSKIDPSTIKIGGVTVVPGNDYRVTVNSFLADGGDNFAVLVDGTNRLGGEVDLDAFVTYLGANAPVPPGPQDRITMVP